MVEFGISHTKVLKSAWFVVQAIYKHKQFFIEYMADHNKQKQNESAFCNASNGSFSSYAGAIDGILICLAKPSEKDAARCGVGRKRFFIGQKISLDSTARQYQADSWIFPFLTVALPPNALNLKKASCGTG
jgi:hypothetical protein